MTVSQQHNERENPMTNRISHIEKYLLWTTKIKLQLTNSSLDLPPTILVGGLGQGMDLGNNGVHVRMEVRTNYLREYATRNKLSR